jgi:hypothetical protein
MTNNFTDKVGKEWLKGVLQNEGAIITFTKKDGTERILKATLNPSVIPEEHTPKGTGIERKKSEDSIAVFDIENNGWRSFRYDSIKQINIFFSGGK